MWMQDSSDGNLKKTSPRTENAFRSCFHTVIRRVIQSGHPHKKVSCESTGTLLNAPLTPFFTRRSPFFFFSFFFNLFFFFFKKCLKDHAIQRHRQETIIKDRLRPIDIVIDVLQETDEMKVHRKDITDHIMILKEESWNPSIIFQSCQEKALVISKCFFWPKEKNNISFPQSNTRTQRVHGDHLGRFSRTSSVDQPE